MRYKNRSVAILTAVEMQERVKVQEAQIPFSERSDRDLHRAPS